MSYNFEISDSLSNKIRRACFLAQNASERKIETELRAHERRTRKNSKSFTQKILLYLAEGSQKRHQRETRISKITKMFNVTLDDADPQIIKLSSKRPKKTKIKTEVKLTTEKSVNETDLKKLHRGSSIGSEMSNMSLGAEDDIQHQDSAQRGRALSMGVLQETSESEEKRRLSAPEVVITPVTKQSSSSFVPSRKSEELKNIPSFLTPQNSFSETEEYAQPPFSCVSPSSSFSPLRIPQEKSSPRVTKSTFKSYSRTSPLLRRLGSHESSTSRRKRSARHQDPAIAYEEIVNPVQDERFLDLLSNLYILPDWKDDETNSTITQPSSKP